MSDSEGARRLELLRKCLEGIEQISNSGQRITKKRLREWVDEHQSALYWLRLHCSGLKNFLELLELRDSGIRFTKASVRQVCAEINETVTLVSVLVRDEARTCTCPHSDGPDILHESTIRAAIEALQAVASKGSKFEDYQLWYQWYGLLFDASASAARTYQEAWRQISENRFIDHALVSVLLTQCDRIQDLVSFRELDLFV